MYTDEKFLNCKYSGSASGCTYIDFVVGESFAVCREESLSQLSPFRLSLQGYTFEQSFLVIHVRSLWPLLPVCPDIDNVHEAVVIIIFLLPLRFIIIACKDQNATENGAEGDALLAKHEKGIARSAA